MGTPQDDSSAPLVVARSAQKWFPVVRGALRRTVGQVHAVDGVDLTINSGQTVGLVGESGSGKSTFGRLVMRLEDTTAGTIEYMGGNVARSSRTEMRRLRREMQMVFQDPFSSLDPMATVGSSIAEPLRTHRVSKTKRERRARVGELLQLVGLDPEVAGRYPQEFSGGQLQRIAIARALSVDPKLVVLDEPVSALDVSTQAEIINLLADLQQRLGIAYLFIAHDLAVVRHVSDRIAVMYLGQIVEEGPAEEVYSAPRHPYTQSLFSAIPIPDPVEQRRRTRIILDGDLPSPANPPAGCRFHTRCPYAMEMCGEVSPTELRLETGGFAACHLHTSGPKLGGEPLDVDLLVRRDDASSSAVVE